MYSHVCVYGVHDHIYVYVCMYVCSMKKYLNESVYARICDSIAPLQPNLQQLSGHVRHAHYRHVCYPALAQVDLLKRTVCMYVCMYMAV